MTFKQRFLSGNLVRWVPGFLISAVAILAVFKYAHIQEIRKAMESVSLGFIIVIFSLAILSLFIRAVAWRTILGNQVSIKNAFFGISEGYFLNNVFPFRAGEFGKALFVGQSSGLGTFHVLSTVLIERAFDILFASSIVLITIPFVIGSDWIKPVAFVALTLVFLGIVGLFFIANNRIKFKNWIESRNFRSRFIATRIIPQMNRLVGGLSALTQPGQFLKVIFWIGLSWVIWMFFYYAAVAQLSPGAPVWWGAFVSSILALGVAIPSAPAALGVFEASMVGALALLGISSSAALAYALILHMNQILISFIFGIWGLIRDGQSFSTLLASLSNRFGSTEQEQ